MTRPIDVARALRADGWQESGAGFLYFRKRLAGQGMAGQLAPDGAREVTLRLDPGAWRLARVDGWGAIERDCRLAAHGSAQEAIAALIAPIPAA